MKKLVFKKVDDDYELEVRKDLTITLGKMYGVWTIYINDTKVADYIDYLKDAKEKALKIANALF